MRIKGKSGSLVLTQVDKLCTVKNYNNDPQNLLCGGYAISHTDDLRAE